MAHGETARDPLRAQRAAARTLRAAPGSLAWLAAAGVVAFFVAHPVRAATYKWVDERGVTHYSDKLPVDGASRGTLQLDKQAVPIRKLDPPPGADSKAKQVNAERAKELEREQEIQARRDRALLASYTSENEIDLARNRVLVTIDTQQKSAEAYSAQLARRRDEILAKKQALGERPLPLAEERELESATGEIAKQQALIEQKRKEREAAVARYDADKARWRELRAISDANREAAVGTGSRAPASGGAGAEAPRAAAPAPAARPTATRP